MVGLAVEGLSSSMDSTATFHLYVTKGFWNWDISSMLGKTALKLIM
jgi:hypothetical protein